jgi:hypothetical protein
MAWQETWSEITNHPEWKDLPSDIQMKVTRNFAKKVVGPEVGKKSDAFKGFIQDNIISRTTRHGDTRQGSVGAGFKEGFNRNLGGLAVEAATGRKALREEGSAIANNPMSILAETTGGIVGELADPIGLAVDAVTGGVGGKLVRQATKPLAKKAIAVGAGATSGTVQGAGSAALQGQVNGEISAWDVAKTGALGAMLGGAIPAATAARGTRAIRAAAQAGDQVKSLDDKALLDYSRFGDALSPELRTAVQHEMAARGIARHALPPTQMEAEMMAAGLTPEQRAQVFANAQSPSQAPAPLQLPERSQINVPPGGFRTAPDAMTDQFSRVEFNSQAPRPPQPYSVGNMMPNLGEGAGYVGPAVPIRNPAPAASGPAYPNTGMLGAASDAPAPTGAELSLLRQFLPQRQDPIPRVSDQARPVAGLDTLRRPSAADPFDLLRMDAMGIGKRQPMALPPSPLEAQMIEAGLPPEVRARVLAAAQNPPALRQPLALPERVPIRVPPGGFRDPNAALTQQVAQPPVNHQRMADELSFAYDVAASSGNEQAMTKISQAMEMLGAHQGGQRHLPVEQMVREAIEAVNPTGPVGDAGQTITTATGKKPAWNSTKGLVRSDAIYTNQANKAIDAELEVFEKMKPAIREEIGGRLEKAMADRDLETASRLTQLGREVDDASWAHQLREIQTSLQMEGGGKAARSFANLSAHGPIFREFRHDAQGAIKKLMEARDGEAVAALHHPEVGDIDLMWGKEGSGKSDGHGLAKIAKYHPEVLEDFQGILSRMHVYERSNNRIQLATEGDTHRATIRLEWDGEAKTWLLTEFEVKPEKRNPSRTGRRTDVPGNEGGATTPAPREGLNNNIPATPQEDNSLLGRILNDEEGALDLGALRRAPKNIADRLGRAVDEVGGQAILSQIEGVNPSDAAAFVGPGAKNLRGEAKRAVGEFTQGERLRTTAMPHAVEAVDPEDFLNFSKLAISEGEANNLARLVQQSVVETQGNPKRVVTFDEIKAEAAKIDPRLIAELRPPKDGHTIHPAVRQAARDRLNAINSEATRRSADLEKGRNTMTEAEVRAEESFIHRLERDAKGIIDVLFQTRSQDGRNLAYHRMTASNSFDADYWVSRAKRAAGGALSDDKLRTVRDLIARGAEAQAKGDKAEADNVRFLLAKELMKLEKTGPMETLLALRKAGLLSSAKTHTRNILGNTSFAALEEIRRVPSVLADMALATATGNRTVAGPSGKAIWRSTYEAATRGVKEAKEVLRHGATYDDLVNLKLGREVNSGNKILDTYANFLFRSLSGEDRVFKAYAYRRSVEAQAKLKAINEGLKGEAARKAAKEYSEKPTSEIIAQAIADAEFATFTDENILAKGIQRLESVHPGVRAGVDLVVPFKNTPLNIVARILDYTGVGLAWDSGKIVANRLKAQRLLDGLNPQEQKAIADQLGRGLTGAGALFLGYKLAEAGLMTGTYQEDKSKRNVDEAANRQTGAIKIGDSWQQVAALAPLGNLLVTGATMYRDGGGVSGMLATAAKSALEQPFFQGLEAVTKVAQDPAKEAPKLVGDLAGSFIPTFVNDAATALDDKKRETKTPLDRIQNRVPVLRNQLPAKVDVLGREVPNDRLHAINAFLSKEAREDKDPVVRELLRLDVGLAPVGKQVTVRGTAVKLSDEQIRNLGKRTGELAQQSIVRLIERPAYQRADDDRKKAAMEKVIINARAQARREILRTIKQ